MNGIKKITDKIAAEAQSEIQAVLDQARAQAEAVTEEFARQARTEEQADALAALIVSIAKEILNV